MKCESILVSPKDAADEEEFEEKDVRDEGERLYLLLLLCFLTAVGLNSLFATLKERPLAGADGDAKRSLRFAGKEGEEKRRGEVKEVWDWREGERMGEKGEKGEVEWRVARGVLIGVLL